MFLAMYSRYDDDQALVTEVAGSCLGAQFKPRRRANLDSVQYGSRDLSSRSETVFECTPVGAKLIECNVAVEVGAACSAEWKAGGESKENSILFSIVIGFDMQVESCLKCPLRLNPE